jgi:hypothetical protein
VTYGYDFDPASYEACRAAAQRHANEAGADFGIERDGFGRWAYRRLPLAGNRYGCDAACEVVAPEFTLLSLTEALQRAGYGARPNERANYSKTIFALASGEVVADMTAHEGWQWLRAMAQGLSPAVAWAVVLNG